MKFAKIFLVRHGDYLNKKGVIPGYLPLPLTPKGKIQIRRVGRFLKKESIAAIFTSPVKRTYDSARILGKTISGKVKVHKEKKLTESGYDKSWQGMTPKQISEKYPKDYWFYRNQPAKLKKSESLEKMAKRMLEAVWQGVKKYPGKNLVFVSHRDPILALLLKISKRSFNDLNEVKPFCDKGSVLEVHLMGRKLVNKSF